MLSLRTERIIRTLLLLLLTGVELILRWGLRLLLERRVPLPLILDRTPSVHTPQRR